MDYFNKDNPALQEPMLMNASEWNATAQLVAVLYNFNTVNTMLQYQSQGTAAIAQPLLSVVRKRLDDADKPYPVVNVKGEDTLVKIADMEPMVQTFLTNMMKEMDERFFTDETPSSEAIAQFLHPGLRGKYLTVSRLERAIKMLREMIENEYAIFKVAVAVAPPAASQSQTFEPDWDDFGDLDEEEDKDPPAPLPATNEVDEYLKEDTTDMGHNKKLLYVVTKPVCRDTLSWWNNRRAKYPCLSRIAGRFLTSHSSTAMQEQKFSSAGQNDKANRHLDEHTQASLLHMTANRERLPPIQNMMKRVMDEDEMEGIVKAQQQEVAKRMKKEPM